MWTVNGELRVGFFSKRQIAMGEEITFDYKFQRYGKEAQKCYCQAALCRGWIGEDPEKENKWSDISGRSRERREKERKKKEDKRNLKDTLNDIDLEEEIEKLVLKNRAQTLMLCRLMVRAEDHASRVQLLRILQNGETACLRLFLDYHGLRLVWSWMMDPASSFSLKIEILETLSKLPIPNKTMLQDSRVLGVVEKWSTTALMVGEAKHRYNLNLNRAIQLTAITIAQYLFSQRYPKKNVKSTQSAIINLIEYVIDEVEKGNTVTGILLNSTELARSADWHYNRRSRAAVLKIDICCIDVPLQGKLILFIVFSILREYYANVNRRAHKSPLPASSSSAKLVRTINSPLVLKGLKKLGHLCRYSWNSTETVSVLHCTMRSTTKVSLRSSPLNNCYLWFHKIYGKKWNTNNVVYQNKLYGVRINITMPLSKLISVEETNYLGITISNTLPRASHIDNICKKLSTVICLVRRLMAGLDLWGNSSVCNLSSKKTYGNVEISRTAHFGLDLWGNSSVCNLSSKKTYGSVEISRTAHFGLDLWGNSSVCNLSSKKTYGSVEISRTAHFGLDLWGNSSVCNLSSKKTYGSVEISRTAHFGLDLWGNSSVCNLSSKKTYGSVEISRTAHFGLDLWGNSSVCNLSSKKTYGSVEISRTAHFGLDLWGNSSVCNLSSKKTYGSVEISRTAHFGLDLWGNSSVCNLSSKKTYGSVEISRTAHFVLLESNTGRVWIYGKLFNQQNGTLCPVRIQHPVGSGSMGNSSVCNLSSKKTYGSVEISRTAHFGLDLWGNSSVCNLSSKKTYGSVEISRTAHFGLDLWGNSSVCNLSSKKTYGSVEISRTAHFVLLESNTRSTEDEVDKSSDADKEKQTKGSDSEKNSDDSNLSRPAENEEQTEANKKKIVEMANGLLQEWASLKEVFRIPKKERIEQMKEHEREAVLCGQ
ncbi:Histone-lysine N-methyltransferase setd2 [Homalodisca vitripennis]|nr:Histone-lysine N-methyltransferase setd2 [Homalodisca vitripennis]